MSHGPTQPCGTPSTRPGRARLAVFLSGGGRTLVNLHERIAAGGIDATVALVVASRRCAGIDRARSLGLTTVIEPGRIPRAIVERLLDEHRVDWAVLAGYLSYFEVPEKYRGRVVNIHPALLPKFGGAGMYGHHVHEAVLAAGERESGCTVHLVDDHYDHGPIVLQRRCPVLPGDTPDTLAARVFELECEAYPAALQQLISGRWKPGC